MLSKTAFLAACDEKLTDLDQILVDFAFKTGRLPKNRPLHGWQAEQHGAMTLVLRAAG
jgi:hypothetical protein